MALFILGVFGTAAFVVYRRENTPDKVYERANKQGNDYYAQHRMHDAIKEYGKMIAAYPDRANGYYFRGEVEAEIKKYDDAISDFNAAASRETEPAKQIHAYYLIMRCYQSEKDWKNALTTIKKMDAGGKFNEEAGYQRAICYDNLKQYDKSDTEWSALVTMYPDNYTLREQRAMERVHAKNYAGAEADCRTMIQLQDKYSRGWGLLGRVKYEQGHNAEAIADYLKALDRAPYYHSTAFNLALAYAVAGNANAARFRYQKALDGADDDRKIAARDDLRDALKKQPDSAILKEELAMMEKLAPKR